MHSPTPPRPGLGKSAHGRRRIGDEAQLTAATGRCGRFAFRGGEVCFNPPSIRARRRPTHDAVGAARRIIGGGSAVRTSEARDRDGQSCHALDERNRFSPTRAHRAPPAPVMPVDRAVVVDESTDELARPAGKRRFRR